MLFAESHWVWIIVACVLSAIALLLLIVLGILHLSRKRKASHGKGSTSCEAIVMVISSYIASLSALMC